MLRPLRSCIPALVLVAGCGSSEPAADASGGSAGTGGIGGGAGAGGEGATGCGACEIENLEGLCVPLPDCTYDGPYIGTYGDDPGVFEPVDAERGVYLDGGEFEVPANSELTQCTYYRLDNGGADFLLGRYEAVMLAGSHHFNMFSLDAAALEAGGVEFGVPRDCAPIGLAGTPVYVAGSEWQYVDAPMPEGLGLKVLDGVALEMQAHFINASPEPTTGRVQVNLFGREPSEVEHEAGLYFNIMQGFEVPAQQTKTFSASCPATEGVNVVFLTSHMHRFGRRFTVELVDDGSGAAESLYESTEFDHPLIVQRIEEPLLIGPGQSFRWSCTFENDTMDVLTEGEMGLTNEMCIMIAYYYDDTEALPYCARAGVEVP